jgi:uncharacterized protein
MRRAPGRGLWPPAALLRLAALASLAGVASLGASALGLPNGALLGSVLVGIGWALATGFTVELPGSGFVVAQAVLGLSIGAYVDPASVRSVVERWPVMLLGSTGTLVASTVAGVVLARTCEIDGATAALGMVAGGAPGIVAMSDEYGADDGLVAIMQYVRVLVIIAAMSIVAGGAGGSQAGIAPIPHAPWAHTLGLTLGGVVAGVGVGRVCRLPASPLLGSILVAAILSLTAPSVRIAVPTLLEELALAFIGLRVGLRFTAQTLRSAKTILPTATAGVVAMVVACAGLGVLVSWVANISAFAGFLATSPGGLTVVLGTAATLGASAVFVVSAQVLRMILALVVAPGAAWLVTRAAPVRLTEPPERLAFGEATNRTAQPDAR